MGKYKKTAQLDNFSLPPQNKEEKKKKKNTYTKQQKAKYHSE